MRLSLGDNFDGKTCHTQGLRYSTQGQPDNDIEKTHLPAEK
jgi:hypothetical protein